MKLRRPVADMAPLSSGDFGLPDSDQELVAFLTLVCLAELVGAPLDRCFD